MRLINSKIKSFIKSKKINVFLLFLILSFLILLLNKLSKDYTNTLTFHVQKINVPEAHVILNDSNHKLDITFKTYGFKWLRYYIQKPNLIVDFNKEVVKHDSFYVWNKNKGFSNLNAQFDKNVEIISINPDTLVFKYGVQAIKNVPIRLLTDIKYNQGYDLLGEFTLKPDSVRLIGPNVVLKGITYINTDTLRLNDVRADIQMELNLNIPYDTNISTSTHKINLSGDIEKFTEGVLKIPLEVNNVPSDLKIKYFPKVINVTYYTSLVYFDSIKAQDFRVECDFSKLAPDDSFLIPVLTKSPRHVKNVKISQDRIEFIITE